ncbi:MAG: carboxypeptidase-like regulatory domain-containing protein [Planctomycetota bacterium]
MSILAAPLIAALLTGAPEPLTNGALAGRVLDASNAPVAGAEVVLLDGATGYPMSRGTDRSVFALTAAGEGDPLDDWWAAVTDNDGAFVFDGVPAGSYRLVAHSWGGADRPADFDPKKDDAGVLGPALAVDLRGVAMADVRAGESTAVEIKPMGDRVFVYHRGAGNDDWYLVVSTAPPAADPVVGFLGWRGAFCANAIGAIRMDDGQAIVRGLPATHVHWAIFANGSSPCFGAGSFRGNLRRVHATDEMLVGGWSDARKEPPERLRPLVDEVRALMESHGRDHVQKRVITGREEAFGRTRTAKGGMFAQMFSAVDVLGPLDRRVSLVDGGTEHTVADLFAAQAYAMLAR